MVDGSWGCEIRVEPEVRGRWSRWDGSLRRRWCQVREGISGCCGTRFARCHQEYRNWLPARGRGFVVGGSGITCGRGGLVWKRGECMDGDVWGIPGVSGEGIRDVGCIAVELIGGLL